ncbi:hypothetical protein DEIPH_ctg011orf0038 [Deinococcus phoenicis]|uniref:Uncharacterized protein n=1 Tax=Deinococcus phoenicis TaxID=1476583 RepID=A0A016QT91_9DEIO|nr:hypothetical protein [Deinococcus phoenicis]EYB69072.1 hypothetical protein DEIPH_ctg011orf0038 [Deinococcus phoenicis]
MTDFLIVAGMLAVLGIFAALMAADMAENPVPWWSAASFLGLIAGSCFLYLLTYHASHGALP